MSGFFKLNLANVYSALVYGVMWGLLTMFIKISEIGSIFNLNWAELLNIFAMAFIGFLIPIVKNLLTTEKGKFVGLVKVIPETK